MLHTLVYEHDDPYLRSLPRMRSTCNNWVWSKGVADRKTRFIALVAPFKLLEG